MCFSECCQYTHIVHWHCFSDVGNKANASTLIKAIGLEANVFKHMAGAETRIRSRQSDYLTI